MPLRGKIHSDLVKDEEPYFESLAELDTWFARPHDKLLGVLPYQPRPYIDDHSDSRAKLLVCHDYKVSSYCDIYYVPSQRPQWICDICKGGYTESPSALCYTFNFWSLCDTFVYFSHHRVTIPPSGWISTAHKQGTRILGTLIFEHSDSDPDCLQLVVGSTNYVVADNKIPISKHYAVLLAELAYQRGFDGYLLNFEFDLPHGADQACALAAWILLLRAELRAKVGSHAQVVWYDSVIYDGSVHYQNRLNGYNLPFFLASDALFTNYWWVPENQESMVRYFENLHRSNTWASKKHTIASKTLQSVYSGVDVWPNRGQYGNSGFGCYRAITYTAPLGFSTAIFGPGWTWEWATERPEQNWNDWWDNERKLWLGPLAPGEIIPVPDSPEGPFKPITAFFQVLPPPDPSNFVFYTCFSPGVGYSWFVEGRKVLDTKDGWTDIDKQSSIGNLVWPWPAPSWQGVEREEAPPTGSTALDMTDGYNGGNTLTLTLTYAGRKSADTISSIWLPVQSLAVTPREPFEARVVYKTTAGNNVHFDPHIHVKSLSDKRNDSAAFTVGKVSVSDLSQGWTQHIINFTPASTQSLESVAIGFVVDIKPKDPSAKVTFSISLGQLAVYPTSPPESVSVGTPSVTGAKFTRVAVDSLEGVLTWNTTSAFGPIDVQVDDKESTTPAWLFQDTPAYRFPKFMYFNIYVALLDAACPAEVDPASAVFIGTTGLDGRADRFYVDQPCFPSGWDKQVGVRFYVQGVTDRGEVLPWERCATVDHQRSTV